jgi:hypothetical protein
LLEDFISVVPVTKSKAKSGPELEYGFADASGAETIETAESVDTANTRSTNEERDARKLCLKVMLDSNLANPGLGLPIGLILLGSCLSLCRTIILN